MNTTVLGAGAWGTALAKLLCVEGNRVTLWGHSAEHLRAVQAAGVNERYLPGIPLPRELLLEPDFEKAIANADLIVVAVPSKAFRDVALRLATTSAVLVSVTKGIEDESGLTMSGILDQICQQAKIAALSGPTLAMEVSRGVPTAIVAASTDNATVQSVQKTFHRPTFRVYTSSDLIGVELAGALKNVIAIAAGVCDGLKYGDNSKAALITRAIVEIRRLGMASGAQAETFAGLSGLGDLTVTCFSKLSRNRGLGDRIGRGEKLPDILASSVAVAEGYPTARSAHHLALKLKVRAPIIAEVYGMLYEGKDAAQSVRDLLSRDSKAE